MHCECPTETLHTAPHKDITRNSPVNNKIEKPQNRHFTKERRDDWLQSLVTIMQKFFFQQFKQHSEGNQHSDDAEYNAADQCR